MDESKDMAVCRIDLMKWRDIRFIHAVVSDIRILSKKHTPEEMEKHVRAVVTEIDDRFGGSLSPDAYHAVVLTLRGYASFVRGNDDETNVNQSYIATQEIIDIVRGDNKMDKNQLTAMTFRRVKEAMSEITNNQACFADDDRITTVAEEYAAKIVTDVFGGKVPAVADFEPEFYEMNPEEDDVLHNGSLVMDGMKVLLEGASFREPIKDGMSEAELYRARRLNRWCVVTERKLSFGGQLSFVGVYDDGVKAKRTMPIDTAWIVKKDSIPRIDTLISNEGTCLEEAPTAKMVAFLKDRMKFMGENFDVNGLKIQTGVDGDVIPLEEYLITEGLDEHIAHYEIIDPQNATVYRGSLRGVLAWLSDTSKKVVNFYRVKPRNKKSVSAEKFLKDHTAEFKVWREDGSMAFSGTIVRILDWAKGLPLPAGEENPAVKYACFSVSRVGAVDGYTLEQFVAQWEV